MEGYTMFAALHVRWHVRTTKIHRSVLSSASRVASVPMGWWNMMAGVYVLNSVLVSSEELNESVNIIRINSTLLNCSMFTTNLTIDFDSSASYSTTSYSTPYTYLYQRHDLPNLWDCMSPHLWEQKRSTKAMPSDLRCWMRLSLWDGGTWGLLLCPWGLSQYRYAHS